MRYFIKLAYNGAPFFGWQRQPNQITVQEVLEQAFTMFLKQRIDITGCGRTDTGVHAREYFAHFDYDEMLLPDIITRLVFRLNSYLPKEIVIYQIYPMPDNAHARFDALSRTYRYYVDISKNPFTFNFAFRVYEKLDVERMNIAADFLHSVTDFTSFSKLNTQVKNNVCEIFSAIWQEKGDQLVFEVTANRFLRNMVRAIVGTLLMVGKGKISMEEFREIVYMKDRGKAGTSVPAHALFLEKIRYPLNYDWEQEEMSKQKDDTSDLLWD